MQVISRADTEVVRILVEHDASRASDRMGKTLLHHACEEDRLDAVLKLIGAGADPECRDYVR